MICVNIYGDLCFPPVWYGCIIDHFFLYSRVEVIPTVFLDMVLLMVPVFCITQDLSFHVSLEVSEDPFHREQFFVHVVASKID